MSKQITGRITVQIITESLTNRGMTSNCSFIIPTDGYLLAAEVRSQFEPLLVNIIEAQRLTGEWPEVDFTALVPEDPDSNPKPEDLP
jgi:hypothetical protein